MAIVKPIRAQCFQCSGWVIELGKREYRLAEMTEWRPPPGIDPKMRQFKCPGCGAVFYKVKGGYE